MKKILEVCVDSVESAEAACRGGADRLEVCANLIIGGTTPGISQFKQIRKKCDVPLHILVRPRYGDFLYTESEFQMICEDIQMFRNLGADGIVTGCLRTDGSMDSERMEKVRELSSGLHLTLHRAFDVCKDPYECLEKAIELKVDTVLTSGQSADCMKGKEVLKRLIRQAEGRINILVGGGVKPEVIRKLAEETLAREFHMSGKQELESKMSYRNEQVNMGLPGISEFCIWRTSEEQIRKAKIVLKEIDRI